MPDSKALALELTIANATDAARNPHASPFMNAAVGRLIEALIRNQPIVVHGPGGFPVHGAHQDAREYLETLAHHFDAIAFNIGRDAEVAASRTIFSDALNDSGLPGDLTDAGEQVIEDAMEDA